MYEILRKPINLERARKILDISKEMRFSIRAEKRVEVDKDLINAELLKSIIATGISEESLESPSKNSLENGNGVTFSERVKFEATNYSSDEILRINPERIKVYDINCYYSLIIHKVLSGNGLRNTLARNYPCFLEFGAREIETKRGEPRTLIIYDPARRIYEEAKSHHGKATPLGRLHLEGADFTEQILESFLERLERGLGINVPRESRQFEYTPPYITKPRT